MRVRVGLAVLGVLGVIALGAAPAASAHGYRSCVAKEPALAEVGSLHGVTFRTACRITKKLATHTWPESDRTKITKWCWDDLGKVRSFDGWNVKIRGFDGPATLSRGGRWFAFLGQEFPISCV